MLFIAQKCSSLFQCSCSVHRPDDTTELMEEAARVALCSNQLTSMDTTAALLKTSPLARPDENTSFTVPTVLSEQQQVSKVHGNEQPAMRVNPGI